MKNQIILIVCFIGVLLGCSSKKSDFSPPKVKDSVKVEINTDAHAQLNNSDGFNSMRGRLINDINEIECLNRFEDIGGRTIEGGYKNNKYGLGFLINKNNDTTIVVFEEFIPVNGKNKRYIWDYLVVPNPKHEYFAGISLATALVNDSIDGEVFGAFGDSDEGDIPYFEDIKKAWRADRESKKIIEIETKGIKIENEGYGVSL